MSVLFRLREMTNDGTEEDAPRKRSNSLPVPKIEVSLYQSPETKRREAASRDAPPPSPEPKYSGGKPPRGRATPPIDHVTLLPVT